MRILKKSFKNPLFPTKIIPRVIYMWCSTFFLDLIILNNDGTYSSCHRKQLCLSKNYLTKCVGVESKRILLCS